MTCDVCAGMGAIEHPEFLHCPECCPAEYLAERVLCGIPAADEHSMRAAHLIADGPS